VDVDRTLIRPRKVVIATGARPAVPPIDGLGAIDYLTNETVWDLDALPTSLAVLGGGAIGCELAQAFARLGSSVTVIEGLDRILPREDPDASAVITEALRADGVAIRTGQLVERIEPLDPKVAARLHLADGSTVEAERLLVAVGRAGAIDGLGLDAAGVETDRGFITTDDMLATTAKGVWAVGDVTGRLQFTHAADEMGRIAAANALGRFGRRRFRADAVPWVTFTDPEVAQVGSTEAEAADRDGRVAYLPMSDVDRAIAAQETLGFVKLIAGQRRLLRKAGGGRVLGATIVASRAGEMIHEPALAMRTGMFTGRLAQTVHAYPTWSVAVRQAAAQFFMETGGRRAAPARGR
jgi:pyruvate/2-oxoglutarate dehydrogenase complex dihydrolipoamide dehydrogenase (E3) component